MRSILVFSILFIFLACDRHTASIEGKKVHLKLIDSLGSITMEVPPRYDAFFSWTNFSDCGKSCDQQEYRYQPKGLRIYKESGWYYINVPQDSIDCFTISHHNDFPFHDGNDSLIKMIHKYHTLPDEDVYHPAPAIFNNIERINNRLFFIVVWKGYDSSSHKFTQRVSAYTTIKTNKINFKFELVTTKNDSILKNFIDNSLYYIRSIKIEKGI